MSKEKKRTKENLKSFNSVIQICPDCNKRDVYENDNHFCSLEYQETREEEMDNIFN